MDGYNGLIIDGETTQTYIEKLDYSITSAEERIAFVNELLKEPNFFTKFYSQTSNSQNNEAIVSRALDIIADYMMNGVSDFITSSEMNKKNRNEVSLHGIVGDDGEFYVESYKGNLYKSNKQKIYAKDFKDPELAEILGAYQKYKEHLQKMRDKAKVDKDGKLKYRCDKIIGSVNQDMVDVKNAIKQPICFKHITPTSPIDGWLECDYTNENHIRALLCVGERNLSTDLGILTFDISQMLIKAKLTKTERKVVNYIRQNEGLTQTEIANELGYTQPYINSTLRSIAKKIVKYNQNLEQNY